jgi:hypothetical protein
MAAIEGQLRAMLGIAAPAIASKEMAAEAATP